MKPEQTVTTKLYFDNLDIYTGIFDFEREDRQSVSLKIEVEHFPQSLKTLSNLIDYGTIHKDVMALASAHTHYELLEHFMVNVVDKIFTHTNAVNVFIEIFKKTIFANALPSVALLFERNSFHPFAIKDGLVPGIHSVYARSTNYVIGYQNHPELPWSIPSDSEHWRELVKEGAVIVGRKTYESLDKDIPGNRIFVVTSEPDLVMDGHSVCATPHEAFWASRATGLNQYCIGGAQLYSQLLEYTSNLTVSEVDLLVDGDGLTYIPPLEQNFVLASDTLVKNKDELSYRLKHYILGE